MSLWNGTKRDRCHRCRAKFGKNTTVTTNGINNQYDNMKMVKQGQFVLPRRGGAGAVGGSRVGTLGLQPGCSGRGVPLWHLVPLSKLHSGQACSSPAGGIAVSQCHMS